MPKDNAQTSQRPPPLSLRHVALKVRHLEQCLQFYTEVVGYRIDWQPDEDNIYLTTGDDNLALHRASDEQLTDGDSRLDHIGFMLASKEQVDEIYQWMVEQKVKFDNPPKQHRDGAYSFYCRDPDNNCLQFICCPTISL